MSISTHDLVFAYPRSRPVLRGVSCTIPPGTVTAIVGPNGAGKSTLVRLLSALRSPQSGSVTLDAQPITAISARARAERIAFIEQRPDLAFDFSVRRVVTFGAYASGNGCARTDAALDCFELGPLADAPYGSLSVGQQQRVSVARAWVQLARHEGCYLLADEPCSAMDPRHTLLTMHALRRLAGRGVGVGVVIHDLSLAARFADRAIVLSGDGTLHHQGPAGEALTGPILSEVFDIPIVRHEIPDAHPVLTALDPQFGAPGAPDRYTPGV